MLQRFLDPAVLAGISGLDLVAKTVVDGFVAGLHRSPDFGFSQEFAEYRAYTPGDDLRMWTGTSSRAPSALSEALSRRDQQPAHVLLDASDSMEYSRTAATRWITRASLRLRSVYLAIHNQRDAAGLIVFDEDVRRLRPPSTRPGPTMPRCCTPSRKREAGTRTPISRSRFMHFQNFLRRRGIVVVISDFYEEPETYRKTVEPLRFRGNEVVLFHISIPRKFARCCEFRRSCRSRDDRDRSGSRIREDLLSAKIDAHIEDLRSRARAQAWTMNCW